jgi:non-structural maintenance of chromosomes element 4
MPARLLCVGAKRLRFFSFFLVYYCGIIAKRNDMSFHNAVQKPREQVADAEALLDIASTLVTSVRSQSGEEITPSDFVTVLLKNFGQQGSLDAEAASLCWDDVGASVPHAFRAVPGCCTM